MTKVAADQDLHYFKQSASGDYDLAFLAVTDANTKGRRFKEDPPSHRSEFQRDRDRIIHSSAFRRLEYKTQVFPNHEGDMFRTRLTHSLEVAQVARTIARALKVNEDLTEAIALAHDLGHTPFGHAGQEALNFCMASHGGFEHNHQSLRVVDSLENRYANFRGLNLLFETREGILKHCSKDRARKLGDLGQRILDRKPPSLEAQIANFADEIAYNHHDIDDGLRAQLLTLEMLEECNLFRDVYRRVVKKYPNTNAQVIKHTVLREMLSIFVNDLIESSLKRMANSSQHGTTVRGTGSLRAIDFSTQIRAEHQTLKKLLFERFYRHPSIKKNNERANEILCQLFNAFTMNPHLMGHSDSSDGSINHEDSLMVRVADYIAGMTDRFAVATYVDLFSKSNNLHVSEN